MEFNENVLARFRLDGKTAVVTGAAGNIGYHTAMTFAQAGANVAIVDLPQCLERSQAVAKEFAEKYGVKAAAYGCDLVDEKAVAELFDKVEQDLGSVDVVHNNAGIGGALMAQIAVNVGMNLRLLPVIGVTLPFYSAGGSSVLMLYICVGLVLSVYSHNTKSLFG